MDYKATSKDSNNIILDAVINFLITDFQFIGTTPPAYITQGEQQANSIRINGHFNIGFSFTDNPYENKGWAFKSLSYKLETSKLTVYPQLPNPIPTLANSYLGLLEGLAWENMFSMPEKINGYIKLIQEDVEGVPTDFLKFVLEWSEEKDYSLFSINTEFNFWNWNLV